MTWRAYPLFARQYEPQAAGTRALLVQGCTNQAHTLTLIPQDSPLGISEFVLHAPPSLAEGPFKAASHNTKSQLIHQLRW